MRSRVIIMGMLAVATLPAPVFAQGTYVSASLTGDILRFSRSDTSGGPDLSESGEAIGFALRVGTPLGSRWGVEAEFVRPSEIETEGGANVLPLREPLTFTNSNVPAGTVFPGFPGAEVVRFPPISYHVRTTYRHTTLSAAVWARQELSRVTLAYAGGIGFHRAEREIELTYDLGISRFDIPIVTETTTYGAHPFAGIDAHIGMTEHLELVTGVRLHGLEGGWLVRPSVGLGWNF
jgi:hypothetical protein